MLCSVAIRFCCLGFVHNMRQFVDSRRVRVRYYVFVGVCMCVKWPFQSGASRSSGAEVG